MGSASFIEFAPATARIQSAEAAYDLMVSEALAEYGHEPYSGTIATTHGYTMETNTPHSRVAATKLAEARIGNYSKWEAAGCIPVSKTATTTRTVKKTITLDNEDRIGDDEIRKLLGLKSNEHASEVKFTADDRKYRTKIVKGSGAAKRVFVVTYDRGRKSAEYATLAAATAAVKAMAEEMSARATAESTKNPSWSVGQAVTDFEIVEQVRRGDNQAARVVTELISRKVKIEVEVTTEGAPVAGVIGWLFFGWAAC